MYQVKPSQCISAFCNPIDVNRLEEYTEILRVEMLSNDFPPIHGYWTICDEQDVGKTLFNGEEVTEEMIGTKLFVVTDGHHRMLACNNSGTPYMLGIDCPLYSKV